MSETLPYSEQEIILQVKLSGQMPALLEGIANRNIIIAAAKANGIEADEAELQQAADQVRLANQLNQAADTWIWLQKQGLSLDEFEKMVNLSVLSTKLAQHLFAEKVEALFAERQIEYMQVALYEIVVEDEDLALELYYAINEGEFSFLDAAKQYVCDQELGRKGGYRGFVRRMDLQAEVRAAVFATEPPQLLKPISSKAGIHLIMVEELLQPQLTPVLRQQFLADLYLEWLKQQGGALENKINQYSGQN